MLPRACTHTRRCAPLPPSRLPALPQTALKLAYWSFACYDYEEVPDSPFPLRSALALYGLQHHELFWDHRADSKALVGWGTARDGHQTVSGS